MLCCISPKSKINMAARKEAREAAREAARREAARSAAILSALNWQGKEDQKEMEAIQKRKEEILAELKNTR